MAGAKQESVVIGAEFRSKETGHPSERPKMAGNVEKREELGETRMVENYHSNGSDPEKGST